LQLNLIGTNFAPPGTADADVRAEMSACAELVFYVNPLYSAATAHTLVPPQTDWLHYADATVVVPPPNASSYLHLMLDNGTHQATVAVPRGTKWPFVLAIPIHLRLQAGF